MKREEEKEEEKKKEKKKERNKERKKRARETLCFFEMSFSKKGSFFYVYRNGPKLQLAFVVPK